MPSTRPRGIPERVRHDHDALDRDGVQAFHRAWRRVNSIIQRQDGGPDRADRTSPQVRDPRLQREPRKDSRAGKRHAGSGCDLLAAARAATAPPRPLSMTRHHPGDPDSHGALATPLAQPPADRLLVLTSSIVAAAGETAVWGRLPVARAVCHCGCVAAGTGSRVGAELAVPRNGPCTRKKPTRCGALLRELPARAGLPPRRCRLCAQCRRQRLRHPDRSGRHRIALTDGCCAA